MTVKWVKSLNEPEDSEMSHRTAEWSWAKSVASVSAKLVEWASAKSVPSVSAKFVELSISQWAWAKSVKWAWAKSIIWAWTKAELSQFFWMSQSLSQGSKTDQDQRQWNES
jgi:hypothetical protein